MARIVRAGEASSEAERRNEGSTKCVRTPEKPDFCEAKSHPKKNSKLDICPIRNAKQFKKWFDQGVPEMKELIAKHKDIHIEADGTTDTIQGDINGKFIRDCFIVFLNTLASNTADTYKFIKPVTGVNLFK